jgi:hypothetical protein
MRQVIVFLVLLVGTGTQLAIAVTIVMLRAKNYPGFLTGVLDCIILPGWMIALVPLYVWLINRIVPYRLK